MSVEEIGAEAIVVTIVSPERPSGPVRRALDALYLWSGVLAGIFLIATFALMLALSGGRVIGLDIPSGDDFASWCMAASAFLGLAYTFRHGDLIRVGLLVERFTGRKRQAMELICLLIALVTTGYFTWFAFDMMRMSYIINDLSQGVIAVPLWIPQIGFVAGLAILFIAFVDEFVNVLLGYLPIYEKRPAETPEEIIERALESGA